MQERTRHFAKIASIRPITSPKGPNFSPQKCLTLRNTSLGQMHHFDRCVTWSNLSFGQIRNMVRQVIWTKTRHHSTFEQKNDLINTHFRGAQKERSYSPATFGPYTTYSINPLYNHPLIRSNFTLDLFFDFQCSIIKNLMYIIFTSQKFYQITAWLRVVSVFFLKLCSSMR